MDLDLSGKRALVCGSSQGMGSAIAQELARSGARVTLFARDTGRLEAVLNQLEGTGHDYLVADFNDLEKVKAAVLNGLEGGDYHILINNTGGPAPGALHQATIDQFEEAMSRHLLVSHTLVKLLLEGMKKRVLEE